MLQTAVYLWNSAISWTPDPIQYQRSDWASSGRVVTPQVQMGIYQYLWMELQVKQMANRLKFFSVVNIWFYKNKFKTVNLLGFLWGVFCSLTFTNYFDFIVSL